MKRKFLVLLMAFVLVFSFSPTSLAAVADGDEVAQPYATNSISYGLDRTSATTADVYVHVFFTSVVESFSVVIYLEKLVNGVWVTDTSNDEAVLFHAGWESRLFSFFNKYENLDRGVSYRIKCESMDYKAGVEYHLTSYSDPF
ncbi:MAG: hypothetical protein IJP00_03925 [Firmicutes bacterium]|nr:hypothetical protein [Bacillota bacterium]